MWNRQCERLEFKIKTCTYLFAFWTFNRNERLPFDVTEKLLKNVWEKKTTFQLNRNVRISRSIRDEKIQTDASAVSPCIVHVHSLANPVQHAYESFETRRTDSCPAYVVSYFSHRTVTVLLSVLALWRLPVRRHPVAIAFTFVLKLYASHGRRKINGERPWRDADDGNGSVAKVQTNSFFSHSTFDSLNLCLLRELFIHNSL